MKKEWEVFVRGVEGRGNEVIATLANLGANSDLMAGLGDNPNLIYYIRHNGNISFVESDTETGRIIMDHYKEIKLPEWKDGDILIRKDGTCYKVFSDYDLSHITIFYAYNVPVSIKDGKITPYESGVWVCDRKDYRLATPSEVEYFHKLLNKSGKDWDTKKKQLIDWKWKPKDNENYWSIIVGITIYKVKLTWIGSAADKIRYELGNCFHTSDEADDILKKVKLLFNKE